MMKQELQTLCAILKKYGGEIELTDNEINNVKPDSEVLIYEHTPTFSQNKKYKIVLKNDE